MFQRILVPLDGSQRAERAIPAAARLAHASHGSIVFIRVVDPPGEIGVYGVEAGVSQAPTALERHLADAATYLNTVRDTYADALSGIPVEIDVEAGHASSGIVTVARLEQVDVIVMCSHGETGLKQWAIRHVAQRAVRHSPVPVLVLNEQGAILPDLDLSRPFRVLIPLDGSACAEEALEPAAHLIMGLALPAGQVHIHLLGVVDVPSANGHIRGQSYLDREIQKQARSEAEIYLRSIAQRVRKTLLPDRQPFVTSSVCIDTDVAGTILREVEQSIDDQGTHAYDVLVMATHGRGGIRRVLLGSVTEHLLGYTMLPLFVVHPHAGATLPQATLMAR